MRLTHNTLCALTVAMVTVTAVPAAQAQTTIKVGSREVQTHGSFQQAFVVSDVNNFLTMETSKGSGAMTDAAFNMASQVNKKLRLGVQFYSRNIGDLGNGQLQIDWGFADYRFGKALGVRAGKMKTALGLYNDTQDMEFLHTWALLPQGVYPLDLRAVTIAHIGADVYGTIGLRKAGSVAYTAHYGGIPDDLSGGYRYGVNDGGVSFIGGISTRGFGIDGRWTTPLPGLMVGYSMMTSRADTQVRFQVAPGLALPVEVDVTPWRRQAFFADFQADRLHLSAEVRDDVRGHQFTPQLVPNERFDSRGWFAAASWRFNDRVEAGGYVTGYVPDRSKSSSDPRNHVNDGAATVRFDVTRFLNVKVEGHLIDGYGSLTNSFTRGFYGRNNTTPASRTKMLVIRTGISF